MTKKEIIEKAFKEKLKIDNMLSEESKELEFYKKFFKRNYVKSEEIVEMDLTEFFLAYMNSKIANDSFEKLEKEIYSFSPLITFGTEAELDDDNPMMLHRIKRAAKAIYDSDEADSIINSFNDSNQRKFLRDSKKTDSEYKNILDLWHKEVDGFSSIKKEFVSFLKFFGEHKDMMDEAISQLFGMSQYILFLEKGNSIREGKLLLDNSKERKAFLNQKFKEVSKECADQYNIQNCINEIRKYYYDLIDLNECEKRSLRKKAANYKKFIKYFSTAFSNDEIKDYKKIIDKIPDDSIRLEAFKLIYEHNIQSYKKLNERHLELMNNNEIRYLSLLKEYDISKDECDIEKIMKTPYDEVALILNSASNISKDKNLLIFSAQNGDVDVINYIKHLINNGVLNTSFILDNPDVLRIESKEFMSLKENLDLLKEKNINCSNFSHSNSTLINSNNFEKNINILEENSLLSSIKNGKDYSFLNKDYLEENINILLELGYENILEEDISILNFSNIKRLLILKQLDELPKTLDELGSILSDDKFIVPCSSIDNYLPKFYEYFEKEDNYSLEELKDYERKRTYKIGDTILSKSRVKQNYNGKNLLNALLKNSYLSQDEIITLSSSIKQKILSKKENK